MNTGFYANYMHHKATTLVQNSTEGNPMVPVFPQTSNTLIRSTKACPPSTTTFCNISPIERAFIGQKTNKNSLFDEIQVNNGGNQFSHQLQHPQAPPQQCNLVLNSPAGHNTVSAYFMQENAQNSTHSSSFVEIPVQQLPQVINITSSPGIHNLGVTKAQCSFSHIETLLSCQKNLSFRHCHFIGHLVGECKSLKRAQDDVAKSKALLAKVSTKKIHYPTINDNHDIAPNQQIPVAATCFKHTPLSYIDFSHRDVTVGEGILPTDHKASLPCDASIPLLVLFLLQLLLASSVRQFSGAYVVVFGCIFGGLRFGQRENGNEDKNCFGTDRNRSKTGTALTLPSPCQVLPKSGTAYNRSKRTCQLPKSGVVQIKGFDFIV
ncbi:hypothetical protein LguiA_023845 [Lonicera macranthoides]